MAGSSTAEPPGLQVIGHEPRSGTASETTPAVEAQPRQPVFYYDLGSAECYLAAERALSALPIVPEWQPVLSAALPERRELAREEVSRLAAERGLQPLRWPAATETDTLLAMRAATYAKQIGRAVAFSLAAFRQAFAGGRDLSDPDTVLIAGAACEMHPNAVLKGAGLGSVATALARATAQAIGAGVLRVPAVRVDFEIFHGDAGLDAAAAALATPSS